MSPDTKPVKRVRMAALGEEFGRKLVELATGYGVSVADYCDRELDAIVTERWRAMLEAKLRGEDPVFSNALADAEGR